MDEEAPDGAERGGARAPRVKTSEMAAIELPDGRSIGVRISDVSASGFRMDLPEPLPAGLRIKLIMRRYDPVDAEIRWSEGLEAGAVFIGAGDDTIR
jgi:hypothetical protein